MLEWMGRAVKEPAQERPGGLPYNRIVGANELRAIPSVERVLRALRGDGLPESVAAASVRAVLAEVRAGARAGKPVPPVEALVAEARRVAERASAPSLVPVVNATGVILQTNLGRAPLSERAIAAMVEAASGYTNLEYDVSAGERGSRHEHVRELIRRATGAEDGMAVNNNASALVLVLRALCAGREVIVSRGEAVEIGGRFRIPDVLRESGATLVEVGTTNRTYVSDYEGAITPETAAILRVHRSNFAVVGFTAQPDLRELSRLARDRGILLIDDLGSGCLLDTTRFGMAREPTVQESLRAGSDIALFSGDKLLGGPQAGIIAGRSDLVATLRRHPLARALRVDKLTIAALNATFQAYVDGRATEEIPVWRMIAEDPARLRRRARRWARAAGAAGAVVAGQSMVGGGSLPGAGRPTWCAALRSSAGAAALAARLRAHRPPIVGRIEDEMVLLDPRTVPPSLDAVVEAGISAAFEAQSS